MSLGRKSLHLHLSCTDLIFVSVSLSLCHDDLLQRSTCTDAQTGSTDAQTGSEEGLGCTYPDRSLLSGSSHGSSFTLSGTGLCAVGMNSLSSSFVSFSSSSAWLSSSSFTLLMSALSSHGAVDSAFSS